MARWTSVRFWALGPKRLAPKLSLLAVGLFVLGLSVSGADARRLSFQCDVNANTCKCDGVYDGADCKAMARNCKNTCTGGGTCQSMSCKDNVCTCTMSNTARSALRKEQLTNPDATVPPAPGD